MGKLHNWRYKGDRPTGANLLLSGEEQGFAIDATVEDGLVTVRDITTPSHNMNNVSLDSSFLVNGGTSPKLVHWDADPYVRWAPHNFAELTEASWSVTSASISENSTTAPDGANTADKYIINSGSQPNARVFQEAQWSLTTGFVYTFSVYAKASGMGWLGIILVNDGGYTHYAGAWFNIGNGSVGTVESSVGDYDFLSKSITSVGNGWYRCSVTVQTATSNVTIAHNSISQAENTTPVGNGSDGMYLWGWQIVRGYNTNAYLSNLGSSARIGIPQEWDPAEGKFGILSESEATNLCWRSQEIGDSYWTITNCSIANNSISAPDGSTTADTLIEASDTNQMHDVRSSSITMSASTIYTGSAYCKAASGGRRFVLVVEHPTVGGAYAIFDIDGGRIGAQVTQWGTDWTAVSNSAKMENIGNGWYRCSLSVTAPSTSLATIRLRLDNSTGTNPLSQNYNGNGTSGLYVWGAQVELGSVATTYVPTLGATVTRARDIITGPVSSIPWSTTAGSLYIDHKNRKVDDYTMYSGFDDGTNGNTWYTYADGGAYYMMTYYDGGFNYMYYEEDAYRSKVTMAAASNDWGLSINGGTADVDTSGNFAGSSITTFRLCNSIGGGYSTDGMTRKVVYVPRRVETSLLPYWRYDEYCSQAASFFARLAIQPTTERKILYNNLIKKMVADGVWAKLDLFYILAAEHQSHAIENLIQGKYTATKRGSGYFAKDRGAINCNLYTHFNSGATSPNYSVSNGFVAAWYLKPNISGWGIGENDDYSIFLGPGGGMARIGGSYAGGYNMSFTSGGAGMYALSRTSVTNVNMYKDGSADASSPWTTASDGQWFSDHDVRVGNDTSPTAMAALGSSLTATEVTNLYNAVRTYLVGVGAVKL